MTLREAKIEDIPQIVAMIADDKLGKLRENYKVPLPKEYYDGISMS